MHSSSTAIPEHPFKFRGVLLGHGGRCKVRQPGKDHREEKKEGQVVDQRTPPALQDMREVY